MIETATKYDENYINNLLNTKAEENTYLEFKRSDSLIIHAENKSTKLEDLKNEIAKDVSAFANADGGILIYGIEEENHIASGLSFIDGNKFSKETLEQIINSRIQRKIDGLTIHPIRFNNEIEKTIYVIDIPRSSNAPHQTKDKKYYKRRNFFVDEMEEFEIRDLYSRKNLTKLKILHPKINNLYSKIDINTYFNINVDFSIEFNIANIGNTVETTFKTEIKIPRLFTISNSNSKSTLYNYFVKYDDEYGYFSINGNSPIFQNEQLTIGVYNFKIENSDTTLELLKLPIIINLYYTNGIEKFDIMLLDNIFHHNGKISINKIITDHFIEKNKNVT